MSYWNGSVWVEPTAQPSATRRESRTANWAATALMLLIVALLIVPFTTAFAASRKSSPSLSVGCGSGCLAAITLSVGSTLMVHGAGFTPSAGGQQVILALVELLERIRRPGSLAQPPGQAGQQVPLAKVEHAGGRLQQQNRRAVRAEHGAGVGADAAGTAVVESG